MKSTILASIGFAFAFCVSVANAEVVYESATLGPTGQGGGTGFDDAVYLASRFSIVDSVQISAVGGHVRGNGFVAIIPLPSPTALPSFLPTEIESNALAGVPFTSPNLSIDMRAPMSLSLPPGDYAIVFGGQGPFGSDPTTSGTMAGNNTELPGVTFFYGRTQQGGGDNQWVEGGFTGARFVVEGDVVAPADPV